ALAAPRRGYDGGSMKAVLPGTARGLLEKHLPRGIEVDWYDDDTASFDPILEAEIAWIDKQQTRLLAELGRARRLRWLFTLGAGIEHLDSGLLRERGIVLTNGSGIVSAAVADYAVMGVLVSAKRYDRVVRLADRREWTSCAPGQMELDGSRALVVGMGAIGRRIATRLAAFGVVVEGGTRSGSNGTLGPDEWRARLGDFDWVVLAAPTTAESRAMIGEKELSSMKPSAWLVNVGRGALVDQSALLAALSERRIGGAFLDTVSPEPLPPEHPLWGLDNCLITMHLSGRSQTSVPTRAVDLFLTNLEAFLAGRPMHNVVDLDSGY
ncbi:NAD(P)-dependent oxidoreductase, partial [Bradyrhizobium sp. UFLA05-109]